MLSPIMISSPSSSTGTPGSVARRAEKLKLGAALDYSIEMGSLTSERQLARVEEHVADALAKGAKLVPAGGKRRPELGPFFYEPTILTGVRPGMKLFAEETFGPVVSVYPFESEEDAIRRANESCYGLNASIWTRDTGGVSGWRGGFRRGASISTRPMRRPGDRRDAAMGGMKQSGLRPRHGDEGLLEIYGEPDHRGTARNAARAARGRSGLRAAHDAAGALDEADPDGLAALPGAAADCAAAPGERMITPWRWRWPRAADAADFRGEALGFSGGVTRRRAGHHVRAVPFGRPRSYPPCGASDPPAWQAGSGLTSLAVSRATFTFTAICCAAISSSFF